MAQTTSRTASAGWAREATAAQQQQQQWQQNRFHRLAFFGATGWPTCHLAACPTGLGWLPGRQAHPR